MVPALMLCIDSWKNLSGENAQENAIFQSLTNEASAVAAHIFFPLTAIAQVWQNATLIFRFVVASEGMAFPSTKTSEMIDK